MARGGQHLRPCAPAPLTQGSRGQPPQSAANGQLPPSHRNIPLECSGVAHGLLGEESTLCSLRLNAHAPGSLRSPYGYLRTATFLWNVPVLRMAYWDKRAHRALFIPNAHAPGSLRSPYGCLRTVTSLRNVPVLRMAYFTISHHRPCGRWCSARLIRRAETLELQPRSRPPDSPPWLDLQNAHASGSLRSPYAFAP